MPFLHNPFILNLSPSLKVFVWAKKDAALLFTETPHRTKTMNSIAISPFAQSTINTLESLSYCSFLRLYEKKSDAELLQAYQSLEDHDSLATLFIRYSAQVLGLCMQYLKHSADAEDAVMDIYTHIQKPLRHQNVQHFKAWIMQVSRNHCLQILRKKRVSTRLISPS